MSDSSEYKGCKIVNIRYGNAIGGCTKILYAQVRAANGELLISATLAYIVAVLPARIPKE